MPNYVALKKMVVFFTGRKGLGLTLEEAKAAKESDPTSYLAYQKLRKAYNDDWKALLQSTAGKRLVPYAKMLSTLTAAGYTDVLSVGFEGFIDAAGKMYTLDKEVLGGTPRFAFYPRIKMNPNYGKKGGDNWVCQGIKVDGKAGGYFYTADFSHTQTIKKHKKVHVIDVLAIRKKWLPLVRKFDITRRDSVSCVILELLWQFTARVGTPGNTTFGISTLQVRHVKLTPNGISLVYKGKDSVNTVHRLLPSNVEHKPLIAAIKQLIRGKNPKDGLFTVDNPDGTRGKVMAVSTNRQWHKLGAPADVTVHKIRTWRGTRLFNEAIEPILAKPPKNLAEAKQLFKKAAEVVGAALNHVRTTDKGTKVTGATALSSYIDAQAQLRYWQTLGYPVPPKLAKFM